MHSGFNKINRDSGGVVKSYCAVEEKADKNSMETRPAVCPARRLSEASKSQESVTDLTHTQKAVG